MNPVTARPRPARALLALLTAFLLAFSGLIIGAAPASAATGDIAGASLQWGVKQSFRNYLVSPVAHGAITVSGNVAATPAFSWTGGTGTSASGTVSYSGSIHFTGHAGDLDMTLSDVKIVRNGASASIVADVVSKAMGSAEFQTYNDIIFATVSLAGTESTVDGAVVVTAAPAVLTEAGAAGFAGFYTAGTALDPVSFTWPVEAAPVVQTPVITVTKAPADGGAITVSGSGFAQAYPGIYVGVGVSGASGFYDAAAGIDQAATKWVAVGDLTASGGSFSVTLTAPASAGAGYSVYASKAHGQGISDKSQDVIVPVVYEALPTPKVTVSKTTGLAKGGETITVSGTGFSPAHSSVVGTRPPLLNQWSGAYVVFGSFKDAWKPSETAPAGNRKVLNGQQRWLLPQATLDANSSIPAFQTQGAPIDANGSFSFELTVAESADALAGGNYGIYSYAAGGPTYAPFETYTPLSFGTPTPPVVVEPTPPAVVTPIASGSLNWGIKESFRSYITSSIAHGTITTSGARASGGSYVFGQAAGGSFTEASGVGTSNYSGAVRFTGHAGVLDVTVANPVVRVDSATSGTLFVTVNGSQIAMANLNLAAANRSVSNGAVTYSGAPAVLTSAGTGVFSLSGSPFYTVGTALDPVTFTIGAPSTASAGSAVVASFQRPATSTPAPTAPATTGVEIVEGEVAPGSTVTIRATGFQPNETGILVVLYSTPTVLDRNATADANGVVTWTGVLPSDFSGEHTLTFQGSVDRGVVVDFGSAAVAALASCVVDNATVTWGFKESFRAYISGSIAHGEWIVGEGLEYETPNFLWKTGTGTFDSDEMTGEIALPGTLTFTGHGGVLNTTLSNLRVQFDGDDTAFLVFDISGDTQAGETIDERNVKFVELDLAAATTTDEDGEISFADVPAELTADGEATFGTYSAGEAFDPVTLTITEGDGCAAVAPTTEATEDEAITPISAQPDYSWLVWVLVALAIVAAVVITLVVRARRKKA